MKEDMSLLAGLVPFRVDTMRWPAGRARTLNPGDAKFRSTWTQTRQLLTAELAKLWPRPLRVILHLDLSPGQLRQDGLPRADARPSSPAVVLAVEVREARWMQLACDLYREWTHNVHAIAKTLEHLRDMERWGVVHGEQYAGLTMIPAVTGAPPGIHSPRDAAEFICQAASVSGKALAPDVVHGILTLPDYREIYYKKAAARLHPDAGGSAEAFTTLQYARRVLDLNQDGGR